MNVLIRVSDDTKVITELVHSVSFASDSLINQLLLNKHYFSTLPYGSKRENLRALQNKVNLKRGYYEKLYATTLYNYNPIENYNMKETVRRDKTVENSGVSAVDNNSESTNYVVPYDNDNESKTDRHASGGSVHSTLSGNEDTTEEVITERSGNIGVTTTQDMLKKERELIVNVLELYIDSFNDFFIYSMD